MREPGLDQILAELKAGLAQLYGDRLKHVVLYGSQARGDATMDSDIDVLVVLDGPVDPMLEIHSTIELVAGLGLKYATLIACVFVSEGDYRAGRRLLIRNARQEGVMV